MMAQFISTSSERRGCDLHQNAMTNALRISNLNSSNKPLGDHPCIVVIGGGYAGISSALRVARQSKAEVHLVNPLARFVERIRLHETASGRKVRSWARP